MSQKWFKSKKYGWGWVPASWQGWIVILLYCSIVVFRFLQIDRGSHSVSDTLINWIPELVVATLVLIYICWKKGEKPSWRWGGK